MREILFRGKDIETGKWVYGYLCVIPQDNQAPELNIQEYKEHQNGMMCEYETTLYAVDPDTVGQYTELKDTNGIMIFEGDIIKANDFYYDKTGGNVADTIVIGEVVWDMDRYIVVMGETEWLLGELYLNDDDFEVIGNIHDDPELLEVEE